MRKFLVILVLLLVAVILCSSYVDARRGGRKHQKKQRLLSPNALIREEPEAEAISEQCGCSWANAGTCGT